MLHRAIQQFLGDVFWGDLDILLLDLPPGTGDIAISVAQLVPNAELLIITTPQAAASEVAERAGTINIQTKQRVAGVIENMSAMVLPDGSVLEVFGSGGGQVVTKRISTLTGTKVPLLGSIPLDPNLRANGDAGRPIVLADSVNVATNYCSLRPRFQRQQMKSLALVGLPLFLSYFLSMYVGNAPKYAIDAYLSDEIQAYYNFIFMPAFAVQLLANFIFNPILTTYAHMWAERKFKTFRKAILRQLVVVAGITAAGLAVAATIGIPILSIIFGVDLGAFKGELCVVMIGGGMLAYVTFFTTVITIICHQNLLLIGYGAVAIAAKLFAKPLVLQFQMMGAASLYALLMACLALFFAVIMVVKIRSDKKKILVKETL